MEFSVTHDGTAYYATNACRLYGRGREMLYYRHLMTRICFWGAIALCSVAASATVVKSSPDETKPRPVTGESACPATNERLQPASALPEGVKAKWQREDPGKYWYFSSLAKCPEFRKSPVPDSDWPGMQALLVNGKGPDGVNAEFFAYYPAPSNAA